MSPDAESFVAMFRELISTPPDYLEVEGVETVTWQTERYALTVSLEPEGPAFLFSPLS